MVIFVVELIIIIIIIIIIFGLVYFVLDFRSIIFFMAFKRRKILDLQSFLQIVVVISGY